MQWVRAAEKYIATHTGTAEFSPVCLCTHAHQGPRERRTRSTLSSRRRDPTRQKHTNLTEAILPVFLGPRYFLQGTRVFSPATLAITKLYSLSFSFSHNAVRTMCPLSGVYARRTASTLLCSLDLHGWLLSASTGDFEPPVERYSFGYGHWGHARPPDAPVSRENPSIPRKNWSTMRGTTLATVSLAGGKWRPPAIRVTRARHRHFPSLAEHVRK